VDCGALTSGARRCPKDQKLYEARRGSRRVRGHYDTEWQRVSKQAIAQHPWCAVCGTEGSAANPLTGDHRTAWVHGGGAQRVNVAVLCRRCNSSKGARVPGGAGSGRI
jgi:5-methylcytosine-specific restriction endonuclease McrA